MHKHEYISFTLATETAARVISSFYREDEESEVSLEDFWNWEKENIIKVLIKPHRKTVIHMWLEYYVHVDCELYNAKTSLDKESYNNEMIYLLHEVEVLPREYEPIRYTTEYFRLELNEAEFITIITDENNKKIQELEQMVSDNLQKINDLIIHSAFQIIMQNRMFLHDFHLRLSKILKKRFDWISENYPENVTDTKKLKRENYWPTWLEDAIFYRDKGTCVICRRDVSGLRNLSMKQAIDHIIPISLYGSNDATNLQILCRSCNEEKGNRSTATSGINVPFWNLDQN